MSKRWLESLRWGTQVSRSKAVRCVCVGASLAALVPLVFVLRDREGGSEAPVLPLRVDDDGSSGLPLRINPTDPWLPDAALQAPLPDTSLTEVVDARESIEPFRAVVIDVPAEPEPAPLPVMSASSSAFGDAATAAALVLLAGLRVRRHGRRSLRKGAGPIPRVVPGDVPAAAAPASAN